ncbi:MAG TPA: DUF4215 domain-containing protein [Kofleriaceae bacterium]|nr:DUF4215 domain-containing protein [Kofleriaceae bacterium]
MNRSLETEVGDDCTLTQGFWKNHEDAWPVASLSLGGTTYTQAELLSILRTPVRGNGLIALAHQLIAAKLNIAAGASDLEISASIADADALIGSLVVPPVGSGSLSTDATSELVGALDDFNNGVTGPGHCGDQPPPGPVCGNGMLETGEECDDGNTVDGDGCSSTCVCEDNEPPPGPVCGNGVVETGEECDDGNTTSGDGCSSTCVCEDTEPPSGPVCGNGVVETGEDCDDGNTTSGDGCSATCVCEDNDPATLTSTVSRTSLLSSSILK